MTVTLCSNAQLRPITGRFVAAAAGAAAAAAARLEYLLA